MSYVIDDTISYDQISCVFLQHKLRLSLESFHLPECFESSMKLNMLSSAMNISLQLVLLILLWTTEEGKAVASDVQLRGNSNTHGIMKVICRYRCYNII